MADRSQSSDFDRIFDAVINLRKSLECTICLELMTEPTKTRCGHSFCKSCIGGVLKKKSASCPLCKLSLNKRSISKDDHLQTCIEKFKTLKNSIEMDSFIDLQSYSKQPRNTKESCSSSDHPKQSSREKEKKSIGQLNQSTSREIDKPSTSRRTMIDDDNSRCDLDSSAVKLEILSNLPYALPSNESDNAIHRTPELKVRTWLHSVPDKLTNDWIDDWNETPTIEGKAKPLDDLISDDGKSDELFDKLRNGVDASPKPGRDKERDADCSEDIVEVDASSQADKKAKQSGKVTKIDSTANKLKYNASHARIRAKKSREKDASSKLETVSLTNSSSTSDKVHQITSSAPSRPSTSAIAEHSTTNWSRVIEFGKEMKRAKKRKVKKLNVSTERKKEPPRIVENITLTPNSKYDAAQIKMGLNEKEKKANVSNRPEANRKQDVIDKSLTLSDANGKALNETKSQTRLLDTDSSKSNYYSAMSTSHITLEEGRKIHIMGLNSIQQEITDFESAVEDPESRKENVVHYCDSLLSPQKRLSLLTPEKLNDSVDDREIIPGASQTSSDNFGNSSCLSAEKRTAGPRESDSVQGSPSVVASSQLQPASLSKGRLSLGRKGSGNKKIVASPLLSQFPLSYRISIGRHEEDSKSVGSPGSKLRQDSGSYDRLEAVKRDLNFKEVYEDQQRADRGTVLASALKSTEVRDNDGNVSGIVHQRGKKLDHSSTGEPTKKAVSTTSRTVANQEDGSPVKFIQLGSLIRRRNIQYIFLGATKRELSMPAEVQVTPVYNMQQTIIKSETRMDTMSPNLWNNSENSNNLTVVENICCASNLNLNQSVSKELPAASATSTPNKNIDSRLSRKSATIVQTRSDKSVAEKGALDKSVIHGTISHTRPGTSNSIKLLSPDKDSQLKFLEIDSPSSEREELRRACSITSGIKGDNFAEVKRSRLATSAPDRVQGPFVEKSYKKRKRMRCADDKELFEDFSDENDDSRDSASDSSQRTIKLDSEYKKAMASRSDANKKRRLSSPNDQDIVVISLDSAEQPQNQVKVSRSDTKSESTTRVKKNLKSDDQCARWNASITDTATKKCSEQNSEDEERQSIRKIVDERTNDTRKNVREESKNNQDGVKSRNSREKEDAASHQSSHSSNALRMEKHTNAKSSQKSTSKEPDTFESCSLFNSENIEYILQQQPTRLNANDTSKKTVDSSNDDIINRVLQIDRSQSNPDVCRPPESAARNDITSQGEKDSRRFLEDKDSFDDIIANVEQPQSDNFIPCTERLDRNPERPLAKQKTLDCPAMMDESCDTMQETPIIPPSSTNDMFEYHSPKKVRKSSVTSVMFKNVDKENVVCSQKRYDNVGDQVDRKIATANAIDKDSRKKSISKENVSREKEKFPEERNTSIQSASRLHVDDGETQRTTAASNETKSKDDTFEDDSLMDITQHQDHLQMFEEDLFGIAARNRMKETKMFSQDDPSCEGTELRTPRKRKHTQDKNMEPGERSADEDDIVENTPEKKMNSGSSMNTTERILNTSGLHQTDRPFLKNDTTMSNLFCTFSQSTPKIPRSSTVMTNPSDVHEGSKRTEHAESSILLAKQVDAKTSVENIRRLLDKRDLRFVCSGLSSAQIAVVKEFAAEYDASYVNSFDRDVTHVIVRTTGEQNAANSTLKYLQGIAHRKWIVSYRWVEDCIKQRKLVDEVPYEATTSQNDGINGAGPRNSRLRDKGLFEGFTFLCVGPYDNVSLNQYQDLLLATGATVVDSFDLLAKVGLEGGMKGFVIQDNNHDEKTIERWYRTTRAAPILVDWIVECIGHYKLFKLTSYISCLSPQDLYTIGYTRDLVEEDDEYDDE